MRAVLPAMRERRSGHVMNITSLAGLAGFSASGYYAATKHAVEGWADSLYMECNPFGIEVNVHRAGTVPDGLGGALAAPDALQDCGLCRNDGQASPGDVRHQRPPGR
ncbi:hypothetical protein CDEF62S_01973 [Castellaniella defragrans]